MTIIERINVWRGDRDVAGAPHTRPKAVLVPLHHVGHKTSETTHDVYFNITSCLQPKK
jgi:hypothetical protein